MLWKSKYTFIMGQLFICFKYKNNYFVKLHMLRKKKFLVKNAHNSLQNNKSSHSYNTSACVKKFY